MYLVIPRATGVELSSHRSDQLNQTALVGGVDVLISSLDLPVKTSSELNSYST